ncbi:MAG: peptidase C14, partial [Nitrospinaceae bacterium]|nr:peptidase C14 [Nitrospinaceae bacterium]NIR57173.1 peptidase C14 [Nitrospinaceae bacterium]NIS87615.1 peptidase C14 [Nitrospinaceae bacterium]NIT84486.1 peptidase C14 [Nitrospinaceae bacterium]NIU46672.1 peptidase C14 [Nitrospinaceae bacterium]
DNGYLTGIELGEFLQKQVVNYSNGSQHPQYGKIRNPHLDKGDFVFQMNTASTPDPQPELEAMAKPAPPAKKPIRPSDNSLDDLLAKAQSQAAQEKALVKK